MNRDVIVMGASAGGVEALINVISGLPDDLAAAVCVVLHLPSTATSMLPTVLQRHTRLRTAHPIDGEAVEPGHIYVAPPNYHLLVRHGAVHLSRGPRENGHRPAIDTLFRSASRAYGPRVIGVVLSGTLDDGSLGLRTIVSGGGAAVVQDPDNAAFPGMPDNALTMVPDAIRAPAAEIGAILGAMSRSPIVEGIEAMADELSTANRDEREHHAHPSVFTCPECHGTIFSVGEGGADRFECRVGHSFSLESLLAAESEYLEAALWTALRTLEERNDLMRRMAEHARRQAQHLAAVRFEERVREGERDAGIIRRVLLGGETASSDAT